VESWQLTANGHSRNGSAEDDRGVIARIGGSVGRVAAGVRRAILPAALRGSPNPLIARTWWGTTQARDADRYLEYLRETGLREYRETEGNRGTLALRRVIDGRADFLLISFWESDEAIRRFAGDEPDRARFYPEDEGFLLDGDDRVMHYDVVFDDRAAAREVTNA
jgi:heme-degrading monooxygenase HmoA